jgi:3-phenylpropionate/trans-cinnamate dioxygenase ferredoxin component
VTLPDGTPVCLYNRGGEIGAVGNVCTHAEFAMSDGVLRPDGTIECVWHGARFDCRTGAVRRHPATDPLPVFEVRVEQGRILVGGVLPTARERSA